MHACLPASCLPTGFCARLHACTFATSLKSLHSRARRGTCAYATQPATNPPPCVQQGCESRMWKQRCCKARIMPSGSQRDNDVRAGNFRRTNCNGIAGRDVGSAPGCHDQACRGATRHGPGGPLCAGVARPTLAAWLGTTAAGAARRASDDRDAGSACGSGIGAGIWGASVHPSFEEPAACFHYGIRGTKLVRSCAFDAAVERLAWAVSQVAISGLRGSQQARMVARLPCPP